LPVETEAIGKPKEVPKIDLMFFQAAKVRRFAAF